MAQPKTQPVPVPQPADDSNDFIGSAPLVGDATLLSTAPLVSDTPTTNAAQSDVAVLTASTQAVRTEVRRLHEDDRAAARERREKEESRVAAVKAEVKDALAVANALVNNLAGVSWRVLFARAARLSYGPDARIYPSETAGSIHRGFTEIQDVIGQRRRAPPAWTRR
jgi:hypothetical protein